MEKRGKRKSKEAMVKPMKILFIGNYQQGPGGEAADETHLARELETIGHEVYKVPRDEWREYVLEDCPQNKYKVPEGIKYDIALIAKWHHFTGRHVRAIKQLYGCPVFFWTWDHMVDGGAPEWHLDMAQSADLYLSGELGSASYYRQRAVNFYYFQFDVCDDQYYPMPLFKPEEKKYDVVFLGSCTNQNRRLDILKAINERVKIKVFGYDYEEWIKQGFDASPAVYGEAFNRVIAQSKIVLGTSACVDNFGYWSNRVGKVLYAGGFLLQWYTPGMELFLADCVEYFSTSEEAVNKIQHYLVSPEEIVGFQERNFSYGRNRWTSNYKVRQLAILMQRYLADPRKESWMLP
jgi:hypothetical protein